MDRIRRGFGQTFWERLSLGLLGGVVGDVQDIFGLAGAMFAVAVILMAKAVWWPPTESLSKKTNGGNHQDENFLNAQVRLNNM